MLSKTQIRAGAVAATAAVALGVAACGSSSKSPSATKTVNPNGPEVSPAGDIPDNQAYVAYSPPAGGFSVKVPEGWARTTAGGVTSFTDKLNRIQMQTTPAKAALTAATAGGHGGSEARQERARLQGRQRLDRDPERRQG